MSKLLLGADFFEEFGLLGKNLETFACDDDELQNSPNIHKLDALERTRLKSVIELFPSYEREGLGRTHLLQHTIELCKEAKPVKQRYFAVSPAVERKIHSEIDRMLDLKAIELASPNFPWSSPVAMAEHEGKVRLCLDSRKLNSLIVRETYPMPKIDGILSRLPRDRYISCLDLEHVF